MTNFEAILLVIGLVLANAFFVGAEFALVSARRTQIEPRAQAGSKAASLTLKAMENLALVIGVNQLGITVFSLVLGAVGEPAIAHLIEPALKALAIDPHWLHPIAFAIALTVVVYLHVVLGEMIPKNLALAAPEKSAIFFGPPIWLLVLVLRPVLRGINFIAARLLRLVGVELRDEVSSTYTREEVAALVEESRGEGLLQADEYDRLAGALGFTGKNVTSVLLAPSDLATIRETSTAAEVEECCADTGFSRFPVQRDERLVGYVHIKDVLEVDEHRRQRPISEKWIRRLAAIPADALLHEALEILQRRGAHMGQVLDTDGQLLGLITMEDVIEELVGQIRDAVHAEDD